MRRLSLFFLILAVCAVPVRAQENSSVNGRVTDGTGAVLPGVTVSLTSPSIQGVKTLVTDESGEYRFILLPPGTFSVKYELPGFKTLIREGIVTTVGRATTLNISLEVAAMAETVTVTGESPVVDVQNVNVGVAFTQSLLDNIPNQRDVWAVLAQTPGVQVTRFDVGGSTMGTQTGYRSYGRSGQNWITLDGVSTTEGTNGAGMYYDYGSFSEVQVTAAGSSAEVAVPGTYINTVMKTGGNQIKGEVYFDWEHSKFQSKNIDDALRNQGLTISDQFKRYNDFNFNLGGPFKKDRFWWFTSIRDQYSELATPLLFNDGKTPGAPFSTHLKNQSAKLNYQLNAGNQLVFSMQRNTKVQPNRDGQGANAPFRIINSTQIQDSEYYTHKYQWTSVLNSRSTLDVSANNYLLWDRRRSHVDETPTLDSVTGAVRGGYITPNVTTRNRWHVNATLSYFKDNLLGGHHDFKFGYGWLREKFGDDQFGAPATPGTLPHIRLVYANGAPQEFRVTDTPVGWSSLLISNSFFIQDKYQIGRRLTINLGLRFDRYADYYPALANPGTGPFSTKVNYPRRDLPVFNNPVPRLSFVYDLFGNTKTAIKGSWGRYAENIGATLANAVNPLRVREWRYAWNGTLPITPAYIASLVGANPANLLQAPQPVAVPAVDPNLKNSYTDQITAGLEHELFPDFGLSFSFVRTLLHRRWESIDKAYSITDYTPVNAIDYGRDGVVGTADDRRVQIYERAVATRSANNVLENNENNANYTGIELTATKRFSKGWQLITGFDWTKTNLQAATSTDPNSLVWGTTTAGNGHYTNYGYKLLGTKNLPFGIAFSGSYNMQKGEANYRTAVFSGAGRNMFNPDGTVRTTNLRQGSLTIPMDPLGAHFLPTVHLINLRSEKTFRITEKQSITAMFDLFNIQNANTVVQMDQQAGTIVDRGRTVARFGRPLQILPPRIFKLGLRYKF